MDIEIKGEWLERAFRAQGVSIYRTAKTLAIRPDKYYNHISGKAHLSAESLAELALLYPTMNIKYILTGEGSPLL
jgi:plasmid maintenance system antidote protein VapI